MEFYLVGAFRCPTFEHANGERSEGADSFRVLCVFDDFGAGVVFLFHEYRIPRDCEKARDFFAILKLFLLTIFQTLV